MPPVDPQTNPIIHICLAFEDRPYEIKVGAAALGWNKSGGRVRAGVGLAAFHHGLVCHRRSPTLKEKPAFSHGERICHSSGVRRKLSRTPRLVRRAASPPNHAGAATEGRPYRSTPICAAYH